MNTTLAVVSQAVANDPADSAVLRCANYAAQENGSTTGCSEPSSTCYGDWYLPSKAELNQLYLQQFLPGSCIGVFISPYYWSSTEIDATTAWSQIFLTGFQDATVPKLDTLGVRCVRAF